MFPSDWGGGWLAWTLQNFSFSQKIVTRFQVGPRLFPFRSNHVLPPQEYKELKGDGPFTIFVPRADLMSNMSQVHSPGRSRERGECSGHGMGRGDSHWLPLSS